eukprot:8907_1
MATSSVMLKMFVLLAITDGFHVETLSKTWWDANAYCETKYGTHLITITDSTMNDDIKNAMVSIVEHAWIGCSDINNEGDFQWIGYNQSSFTDWTGSEPSNSGNGEDCCEINLLTGHWNDEGCSDLMAFVCAEPGDYPVTSSPSGASLPPTSTHPTSPPSISPTSSCLDYNNETSADGRNEMRKFDDEHITNVETYFMNTTFVLKFNSSRDNYQHRLVECVGSHCFIQ